MAEPTCNYPFVGHKGALWLRARTSGVTAHGSMPERGVNAVYKAARAVLRLERFGFDVAPHPVLGAPDPERGDLSRRPQRQFRPRLGRDRYRHPNHSRAEARPPCCERLTAYLGDEVALENLSDAEGVWTDPGDPWIQSVYDVVAPVIGERPGGSRRALLHRRRRPRRPPTAGIPTVILGPGELTLAHQTDEYCEIERLEQAVDLFTEITQRWCKL